MFIKNKKQLTRLNNLTVSILAEQFKDYNTLKSKNKEKNFITKHNEVIIIYFIIY